MKLEFITKKWGPLPAWAWILIGVAALLIVSAYKKNQNATATNTSQGTPAQATLTAPGVTLIQEGFSGPPNNQTIVNSRVPYLDNYVGKKYTVQAGDTVDSIVKKFYGTTNKDITERILADANGLSWNEAAHSFAPLQPGQQLLLTTNGIVNVQPNSLNSYDAGHGVNA